MDWQDRLALFGRRYEPRRSGITASAGHHLGEVLLAFRRKTILELEVRAAGEPARRQRHRTGAPISLVDAVAAIHGGAGSFFEILETAPSGDFSRVKIISRPGGGELSMLVGERMPEHHSPDDALLEELHHGTLRWDLRRTT